MRWENYIENDCQHYAERKYYEFTKCPYYVHCTILLWLNSVFSYFKIFPRSNVEAALADHK